MEQGNVYVVLGAVVEESIASKFKEKIGKAEPDEVIKALIEMVAFGELVIKGKQDEKKICNNAKKMHRVP